jgi:hypothetical protein
MNPVLKEEAWLAAVRKQAMSTAERVVRIAGEQSPTWKGMNAVDRRDVARVIADEIALAMQTLGMHLVAGGGAFVRGQVMAVGLDGKKIKLTVAADPKHSPEEAATLVARNVVVAYHDVGIFEQVRDELYAAVKSIQLDFVEPAPDPVVAAFAEAVDAGQLEAK